jgi:integrase
MFLWCLNTLFEKDMPPEAVQALMVHSDISVTMYIYTMVKEDKKFVAFIRYINT